MDSCSLQATAAFRTIPKSFTKTGLRDLPCQVHRFPNFRMYPHARKLGILDIKAQASSATETISSQASKTNQKEDARDENLAFVAGATGRVGSRTVRELIKLGFRVRAAVRSSQSQKANSLVESVKQMKIDTEGEALDKLELVECDLEKKEQIGPAIGNASAVLCCIGASEKEVFDITGPYRIDYQATRNLIDAAAVAKVKHFIMVSSLGTNKIGFPAAILNLFWGVLLWKRKAEEALIASGVPYTIVRPGGMERPTDSFKETHNLTLSEEDALFGGLVSNLQVAELIAFMAKNFKLSCCKVVEAVAETTAPLKPMDELLLKIPSQRVCDEPKDQEVAEGPKPVPVQSVTPEALSTPTEEKPELEKVDVTRPLSPYTAYADLKPPTSPTPTAPSSKKEDIDPVDAVLKTDDSENQTSPSLETVTEKKEQPLSPYAAYADLKPPTSPSPTAPVGSFQSTSSADSNGSPPTTRVEPKEDHTEIKPRPLSPYAMYEDMKPPTSPSPSARKFN